MKRNLYFGLIAVLFVLVQGCTIAKVGGKGAVPLLLNQPSEQMELVEHVKIKKNINFDYTNSFDASEILAPFISMKKPDAVINTTITIQSGVDNYFINLFTFGLAQSRKVVVEGDLMKSKNKSELAEKK